MSFYLKAPQAMKRADMKNYTPVTADNRKNAAVLGRVLYIISDDGAMITYNGFMTIRPRLTKGKLKITNHPHLKDIETFIPEDEPAEVNRRDTTLLIDKYIREKSLYVNLKDSITKYTTL